MKQQVRNKSALVRLVAEAAGQHQCDVQTTLDAFETVLQRELAAGARVVWTGVGSFMVRTGDPRPVRHVGTGRRVMTRARRWVAFRAGRGLKAAIKEAPDAEEDRHA